ncbi:hypothetical protein [Bartonella florencae]|uniref:hypothetical protein n=1 Tax=Bartonella florencae TaxID=928210 RepID=UPI00031BEDF8|nr:hypothetical protein [Bartonella florencae]
MQGKLKKKASKKRTFVVSMVVRRQAGHGARRRVLRVDQNHFFVLWSGLVFLLLSAREMMLHL